MVRVRARGLDYRCCAETGHANREKITNGSHRLQFFMSANSSTWSLITSAVHETTARAREEQRCPVTPLPRYRVTQLPRVRERKKKNIDQVMSVCPLSHFCVVSPANKRCHFLGIFNLTRFGKVTRDAELVDKYVGRFC